MSAAISLHGSDLRLVLADQFEENNRLDIASLYRDDLPFRKQCLRRKLNKITAEEKALFPEYVDKWIKIGHCTERADRDLFEAAVRALYRYSNLEEPQDIIWCPSPFELVLTGDKNTSVHSVFSDIYSAVVSAVDSAFCSVIHRAVDLAVAVCSAVDLAVGTAAGTAVDSAVRSAVGSLFNYLGGQFWASGISGAFTSFMLDALNADIGKETELKARACLATTQSACWWYATSNVVFVSERPSVCKVQNNKLEALRWDWIDSDGASRSWIVK